MIIEIWTKEKYSRNEEADMINRLSDMGAKPAWAKLSRLYRIDAEFDKKDFDRIVKELLIDPITEKYSLSVRRLGGKNLFRIEIWLKDSVTDVVGESVQKSIKDIGLTEPKNVRFGHAYYFSFNPERPYDDSTGSWFGRLTTLSAVEVPSRAKSRDYDNLRVLPSVTEGRSRGNDSERRLKHAVSKTLTNELIHVCRIIKYGKPACKI